MQMGRENGRRNMHLNITQNDSISDQFGKKMSFEQDRQKTALDNIRFGNGRQKQIGLNMGRVVGLNIGRQL